MKINYRIVLRRSIDGIEVGTIFGEYHSYYSAVIAANDSPYSDDLDILDVRQGGYNG
jgi:hypothetical protein